MRRRTTTYTLLGGLATSSLLTMSSVTLASSEPTFHVMTGSWSNPSPDLVIDPRFKRVIQINTLMRYGDRTNTSGSHDLSLIHYHGDGATLDPTSSFDFTADGCPVWMYVDENGVGSGRLRTHPYRQVETVMENLAQYLSHEQSTPGASTGDWVDLSNIALSIWGATYGDGRYLDVDPNDIPTCGTVQDEPEPAGPRLNRVATPALTNSWEDALHSIENPLSPSYVDDVYVAAGCNVGRWLGAGTTFDVYDLNPGPWPSAPISINQPECMCPTGTPVASNLIWDSTPWAERGIAESRAWYSDYFARLAYRMNQEYPGAQFSRFFTDEERLGHAQYRMNDYDRYKRDCDDGTTGAGLWSMQAMPGAGSYTTPFSSGYIAKTLEDLHTESNMGNAPFVALPFEHLDNRDWAHWYQRVLRETYMSAIDLGLYSVVRDQIGGVMSSSLRYSSYGNSLRVEEPFHFLDIGGNWGGNAWGEYRFDAVRKVNPVTNEQEYDERHVISDILYPRGRAFYQGTSAEAQAEYEAWWDANYPQQAGVPVPANWNTNWEFQWERIAMPFYRHNMEAVIGSLAPGETVASHVVPWIGHLGQVAKDSSGAPVTPTLTPARFREQLAWLRGVGVEEFNVFGPRGSDSYTVAQAGAGLAQLVDQVWRFDVAALYDPTDTVMPGGDDDIRYADGTTATLQVAPTGGVATWDATFDCDSVTPETSLRLTIKSTLTGPTSGSYAAVVAIERYDASPTAPSPVTLIPIAQIDSTGSQATTEETFEFSVPLSATQSILNAQGQATIQLLMSSSGEATLDVDLLQLVGNDPLSLPPA